MKLVGLASRRRRPAKLSPAFCGGLIEARRALSPWTRPR